MAALLATAAIAGVASAGEPTHVDLFDPRRAGAAKAFVVVNDDVMGGVSTSRVHVEGDALVFAGTVRLDHGGGFASMRATPPISDLGAFAGIELVVRGDGRRYKLNLRDEDGRDGVVHRAAFETRAGERQTVRLPFESFAPAFRGRPVPGAPPLDRRRIRQLGVLVSDRQAGDFRLELLAIRAYR